MTLRDFCKITRHIALMQQYILFDKPDAVCVSRAIYESLKDESSKITNVYTNDCYEDRIVGLSLFVDDDMPDDFYCVGHAKMFIDTLRKRKVEKNNERNKHKESSTLKLKG